MKLTASCYILALLLLLVDGLGSITRVTATNLTEAGNYQCTVSNARVTAGTINGVTAVSNTSSLNVSG